MLPPSPPCHFISHSPRDGTRRVIHRLYVARLRNITTNARGYIGKIIPLFTIASLDCNRYPDAKIRHLAGDPTLVNCNLLDLSGLLSSKYTRQQYLGLPSLTPPSTVNHLSNSQAQPPLMGRPQQRTSQLPMTTSPTDCPPPRGVPWNSIAEMVH